MLAILRYVHSPSGGPESKAWHRSGKTLVTAVSRGVCDRYTYLRFFWKPPPVASTALPTPYFLASYASSAAASLLSASVSVPPRLHRSRRPITWSGNLMLVNACNACPVCICGRATILHLLRSTSFSASGSVGFLQANTFFLHHPFFFTLDVSCRTRSAHGYGSADPIHQARSRCTPPDQKHPACRNCDRKCSALEAEVVAISSPCSSSAVADVVPGSQNRPTAGVREGGRSAACEAEALLVVVVVVGAVVPVVAVEDRTLRVCGHSIEPSLLCHSFA